MGHHPAVPKGSRRAHQEFLQLARTLFIAPVADPDHINLFRTLQGFKELHVRSFVKSPGSRHAKAFSIDAAYGFTESQHPVNQVEMKLQNFARSRISAVMRIVEQSDKAKPVLERKYAVDHQR